MCNVVITHFLRRVLIEITTSSKDLKWVLIWSSFYSKSPRFTQKSSLFPPMKRFLTSSPQSKIPGALGAIFGSSFLLEKVPISLKGGSPFWNVLTQPSPYLADPLPNAPTVVTLKFTKGAECRTPRSRMQNQGPNAEHHVANFLGVMLILRSIFWPLKRKLMEFSCHIQLSSVPPRCVMLWRSPEMNFIRHPRVTKLFCIGPPLKQGPRHNLL